MGGGATGQMSSYSPSGAAFDPFATYAAASHVFAASGQQSLLPRNQHSSYSQGLRIW